MDASNTSTFEPSSDLIQEEDCNTLLVYLPGFTREQLKVQLTRTRVIKISGRRPLPNNRWSSFQKDFPVPENCDTNKISAKFEEGILYVRLPKEEKKLETPQPQKPAEKTPTPTPTLTPAPPAAAAAAAKIDPSPPRAQTPIPNKTGKTSDDIKQGAAKKPVESKEETKSGEKSRKDKSDGKAEGSGSGSGGDGAAKVEADYNKLNAASPAARLKVARQQMTNIVLLLLAFGLGIYISRLPWFSKRAQQD